MTISNHLHDPGSWGGIQENVSAISLGTDNFQDSDPVKHGSPPHSDTGEIDIVTHKRKSITKHNWITCKEDGGVDPRHFPDFSSVYVYMHE